MAATKRQNFNISPEQEAEIAQLKDLIDAPTTKDAILSAVRVFHVLAQELKSGHQIYLSADQPGQMQRLLIPEIENLRPPKYKYLVQHPHEWKCQLYVKGRRLPAANVYSDYLTEGRTPEQLSDDWDLPIGAIKECISYCQDNKTLLQMEADEELRQLTEKGINLGSPPTAR